jgi:hypothetical protein
MHDYDYDMIGIECACCLIALYYWYRYGLSGLTGVLLRQDFVEAVETLKKISGMVTMVCSFQLLFTPPLSLSLSLSLSLP